MRSLLISKADEREQQVRSASHWLVAEKRRLQTDELPASVRVEFDSKFPFLQPTDIEWVWRGLR